MSIERVPRVLWPKDIEHRYSISGPTRWRWEKTGKLPARDVSLRNGGWRETTIEAHESGAVVPARAPRR